jgi:tetratricopeptide (TPR) repeat protein
MPLTVKNNGGDRRFRLAAFALAVVVLAVYGQTARHGFLNYDDNMYVSGNPVVGLGLSWAGLAWSFGFHAGNWHPLTWLSHMFDVQLFGNWAGGHHLVSAVLHATNAVLLLALLRGLTGAFWRSAAVAALFAVHPLRVESVAWVAERKDVLSALFWLLTMLAYLRYVRHPVRGRYLAVVALFAAGLAVKPMLVTLPCALLILDWWPLNRFRRSGAGSLIVEKIPLLAFAAASIMVTWQAQTTGITRSLRPELPTRLANAAISTVLYLRDLVWPADLAVLYPYPLAGFPWQPAAAALTVVVIISAAAILTRKNRPFLAAGWFWYLGTIVPVIGLVQVGAQSRADRYTYLPLVGVVFAVVWLTDDLWPRRKTPRRVLACLLAAVLLALSSTLIQAGHWRDTLTLMRHADRVTTNNYVVKNVIGAELLAAGRVDEAVRILEETVRISPDLYDAHYNLGNALYRLGRYREALAHYYRTLNHIQRTPDIRSSLGYTSLRLNLFAEAEHYFREVLRLAPDDRSARIGLTIALEKQGKPAADFPGR